MYQRRAQCYPGVWESNGRFKVAFGSNESIRKPSFVFFRKRTLKLNSNSQQFCEDALALSKTPRRTVSTKQQLVNAIERVSLHIFLSHHQEILHILRRMTNCATGSSFNIRGFLFNVASVTDGSESKHKLCQMYLHSLHIRSECCCSLPIVSLLCKMVIQEVNTALVHQSS